MANNVSARISATSNNGPVPIIVHGAAGRMGARIITLAMEDANLRVIAGVDKVVGQLRDLNIPCDAPLLVEMPIEPGAVVIDFSNHTTWKGLVAHCAKHNMGLVSGTTGISPMDLDDGITTLAKSAPVLHAPNMSVGVNVVFRVAAQIARTLGLDYDIEVVESHHNQKVDAPSGTAFGITDAICAATHRTRSDLKHGRIGQTGARTKGEIGVHALRMGDVVGDHTVYFVGNGERVMLSHVAHSRDIFVKGALRAAGFIGRQKPGRYTMENVLGL
jgi:4-hydroxy-tetrahydrodipicolinate reductase